VRAVALVILLGLGVGALGLVAADLYVVGVLILFVGGIGLAVVVGDRLMRYAHNRRPTRVSVLPAEENSGARASPSAVGRADLPGRPERGRRERRSRTAPCLPPRPRS
jgi:hypothetical protein